MNITQRISWTALILAALLKPAQAEDFSFTVPYDAMMLPPEIRFLRVTCTVWDGGKPIGTGHYQVPVTGGVARGEALVAFSAYRGQDPQRATRWTCGLIFDEDEEGGKSYAFTESEDSFPTVSRNITAEGDIRH